MTKIKNRECNADICIRIYLTGTVDTKIRLSNSIIKPRHITSNKDLINSLECHHN